MDNTSSYYAHFIRWMEDRLGDSPRIRDKGAIARLKRADSPQQDSLAWDIILRLKIPGRHLHHCLAVAAPMCRRGDPVDGKVSLGQALASCYDDKEQGKMRLQRILRCTDSEELRQQLRPLLSFIDSRARHKLCYGRLLDEIIEFDWPHKQERFKLQWTQDFWNLTEEDEESA